VVSVVSIVAGIAVPSLLKSAQPMRLRNDAHAIASLITKARMRAPTEFSHVEVSCTTNVTPAYCNLESSVFPNVASFAVTSELDKIYLSEGVSFGVPPTINTYLMNQPTAATACQGDSSESGTTCSGSSTVSTTVVIPFNSRGLPVDVATGGTVTGDYALYLKDTSNNYYAVSVNYTGHPSLYWWSPTGNAFTRLYEYSNPTNSGTQ